MGVEGISQRNAVPAESAKVTSGANSPGGHGFALLLEPALRPADQATRASMPLTAPASVQAEVDEIFARQKQDRDARRHGRAMLKALGTVQLALLGSDPSRTQAALQALADTVRDSRQGDDPVLRLILREIGVRAAVELARNDLGAA